MPDMAVSDRFILSERYIKVDAPDDAGFAGFWCEVRQNLSNGERRLLIERLDDLALSAAEQIEASRAEAQTIADAIKDGLPPTEQRAAINRLNGLTAQMETLAEESRVQRWKMAAPYVRDWNAYVGEPPEKVEPPAVAGAASLDAITREMADWITSEVLQAYRSGKGVLNRSTPPGDSGRPAGGPKQANGKAKSARIPRSQTTSPGLSPSQWNA